MDALVLGNAFQVSKFPKENLSCSLGDYVENQCTENLSLKVKQKYTYTNAKIIR